MEFDTPVGNGTGEAGKVLGLEGDHVTGNVLVVEVPKGTLLFNGGIALSLLLFLGIGVSLGLLGGGVIEAPLDLFGDSLELSVSGGALISSLISGSIKGDLSGVLEVEVVDVGDGLGEGVILNFKGTLLNLDVFSNLGLGGFESGGPVGLGLGEGGGPSGGSDFGGSLPDFFLVGEDSGVVGISSLGFPIPDSFGLCLHGSKVSLCLLFSLVVDLNKLVDSSPE